MADRFREAVVVFLDVEAVDRVDALHVAESIVKATIRQDAGRVVQDAMTGTINVTAGLRGQEITGRIVAVEHLALAMGRHHLQLDPSGGPWEHLDGDPDE